MYESARKYVNGKICSKMNMSPKKTISLAKYVKATAIKPRGIFEIIYLNFLLKSRHKIRHTPYGFLGTCIWRNC